MSNSNFTQVDNTVLGANNLQSTLEQNAAFPGESILPLNTSFVAAADVKVEGLNVALTAGQLLKAAASPLGLIVDATAITAGVELTVPDFTGVDPGSNAHARELQGLLGITGLGDQVSLTFTNFNKAAAFAVGLEHSAGTGTDGVKFADFAGALGATGSLFVASAAGSQALVVATNTNATSGAEQIVFTTVHSAEA